jgi:prepilin-type N-terminal cleavage/methylation domain-containing protein
MKPKSFIAAAKQGQPTQGFTFIELLVVLAVVALLFLMLLPALARTKGDSRGFQCLTNNRELNRAWRMWTDDNNDLLLYAAHNGSPNDPNNQRAWVISELDYSATPRNWDVQATLGPSPMWPYCRSNASIWRCPSDESYVLVNGVAKPRVRSYSMNFYLGGFGGSVNGSYAAYRLYLKSSDMVAPSPDRLFVFLDQRPDSINWGSFVTVMDGYSPSAPNLYRFEYDFPGFYHHGAATFSYADGHGEVHQWQDLRTTPPLLPYGGIIGGPIPSPRNVDIAWLQDKATRPK